jgi:hypothetical protein
MRTLVIAVLILSFGGDAVAKRRHARHKKQPARAVHIVHDDAAAKQYERAEAELAELRSSKELPAEAPQERVHYEQDNDSETPAPLRRR